MKITLSPPPKILQPNNSKGAHWGTLSSARKKHRRESFLVATEARRNADLGVPAYDEATVAVAFFVKDKRGLKQDGDNAVASLKAAFDGIADAGVVDNDRCLRVLPPTFEVDAANPRVELTITPASAKEVG